MDGNGIYIDRTIPGNAGGAYAPLGRIDKFELVRELGEGGFGAVYLARDTVAGIDVAIKGLPPEVKHNESELEPIRANFALVKRLRHPNIVAVTDLHCAQDVFYAGKDVEDRLRGDGRGGIPGESHRPDGVHRTCGFEGVAKKDFGSLRRASGAYRVLRGGCWRNLARSCRSAGRGRGGLATASASSASAFVAPQDRATKARIKKT